MCITIYFFINFSAESTTLESNDDSTERPVEKAAEKAAEKAVEKATEKEKPQRRRKAATKSQSDDPVEIIATESNEIKPKTTAKRTKRKADDATVEVKNVESNENTGNDKSAVPIAAARRTRKNSQIQANSKLVTVVETATNAIQQNQDEPKPKRGRPKKFDSANGAAPVEEKTEEAVQPSKARAKRARKADVENEEDAQSSKRKRNTAQAEEVQSSPKENVAEKKTTRSKRVVKSNDTEKVITPPISTRTRRHK